MNTNHICITTALFFALAGTANAAVTGQWDFNSSNLVATTGTDLTYRGGTEAKTTFTTMMIGGTNAVVMAFPATAPDEGYVMTHGIAPNGGGSYVNQYTLIMDIMFPTASSESWRSLWQTSQGNANDGDLFVDSANRIGIAQTYDGNLTPNVWHRVAFVFDLTLTTQRLKKYIDGVLVGAQDIEGLDSRYSLDPTALLFTDEDNETAAGYVNSIQIHDVPLSPGDIMALGVPSAAGIPKTIPVLDKLTVTVSPTNVVNVAGMTGNHFTATAVGTGTISYQWYRNGTLVPDKTNAVLRFSYLQFSDAGDYTVVANAGAQSATSAPVTLSVTAPATTKVTGQWDFQNGLAATIGEPLGYFNSAVQQDVQFKTTTELGISDVGGQPTTVMALNPNVTANPNWGGLVMTHGIAPNGGGVNVNQYTIIMDLLYANWTSGFYRALLQTDISNTNDADAFFNGNNGLGISSTYQGTLELDAWHRVVLTFDLTRREMGKYIDGTNVLTSAVGAAPFGPNDVQYLSGSTNVDEGGSLDMRWSLGPKALLFADDDGEVQPVYISSIQVRSGRMTDADIAAMGTPTAAKIPGAISVARSGNNVVVSWTGTELQSATSLKGPWTTISGASHPYTVTAPAGTVFFRVSK